MGKTAWIFVALLAAAPAEAQVSNPGAAAGPPKWDLGFTVGLMERQPGPTSERYGDDWYHECRYALAVGYYWTEHVKTEVEIATTGEGSRYVHELVQMPGSGYVYPYSREQFHRLHQASARLVYQFGENAWVHPYVSAGFVYELDRQRLHVPEQFQYPPRSTVPVIVRPELESGPTYEHDAGVMLGGGTKLYVSRNAFFNPGMLVTYAAPSTTVTFLMGFGIDF